LDRRILLLLRGEFQQMRGMEVPTAGDDRVREDRLARVVEIHRSVVELTAIGNLLFQSGDARLQLQKVVVRLQVRILLGDGIETSKAAAQSTLGARQVAHIAATLGGRDGGASLEHALE